MDGRRRAEVQAQRGGGQRERGPFRGSPVPPRIVDGRSAGRGSLPGCCTACARAAACRAARGREGGGGVPGRERACVVHGSTGEALLASVE